MSRERDNQRQKVYNAENAVDWGTPNWWTPEFVTVEECQAFIDSVLKRKRVQARWTNAGYRTVVKGGAGRRRAAGGMRRLVGVIEVPKWARSRHILLHELAHVLTDDRRSAWHDWRFCECSLFLVRQVLGVEMAKALEAQYKAGRVKYRQPRAKRQLSDEQRAVLVERMAKARAAKALQSEDARCTIAV